MLKRILDRQPILILDSLSEDGFAPYSATVSTEKNVWVLVLLCVWLQKTVLQSLLFDL